MIEGFSLKASSEIRFSNSILRILTVESHLRDESVEARSRDVNDAVTETRIMRADGRQEGLLVFSEVVCKPSITLRLSSMSDTPKAADVGYA